MASGFSTSGRSALEWPGCAPCRFFRFRWPIGTSPFQSREGGCDELRDDLGGFGFNATTSASNWLTRSTSRTIMAINSSRDKSRSSSGVGQVIVWVITPAHSKSGEQIRRRYSERLTDPEFLRG